MGDGDHGDRWVSRDCIFCVQQDRPAQARARTCTLAFQIAQLPERSRHARQAPAFAPLPIEVLTCRRARRYHNRKFADELGLPGMFLRAAAMFFRTQSGHTVAVTSPAGDWEPRWHAVFDAMGMCPLVSAEAALPLLSGAQAASGSSFGSIEHEPLARSPTSATSQEQGPGVLQAKDHEPQLCQGAGSSQHAGLGADEGSALRLQADQWSAGLASGGAWSPGFCEPLPLLGSLPSLHMVARVSQEHVTPSSLQ